MEDCYICYNSINLENKNWVNLECNHKMCNKCYLILTKNKEFFSCPFCRQVYKNNDYKPFTKTNNPQLQLEIELEIEIEIPIANSRLNRNRFRRRRRNLSFEEIKERRENIKKRCKKKWINKNNRLNKLKWYEIN